ncbi:unnamed protein product [Rotaria sp. Silwood2]|nr:unnamed protein product [Rotaria sp. Silwood2]CAF4007989.1 unnamed protein product [Rotaria sp. Silwood2]
MYDQRYLYVSDMEKNEVRQYLMGENNGAIVAGGHGRGVGVNQLNGPTYIFVDRKQTVYVSDTCNHRVMKWDKNAKEGTVVFLGFPRGLFVDTSETIYIADYGNHRLMRWAKGDAQGTVIAGGNREDQETNQVYHPWGLSYQDGHLYVADHLNHRVQRVSLKQAD